LNQLFFDMTLFKNWWWQRSAAAPAMGEAAAPAMITGRRCIMNSGC